MRAHPNYYGEYPLSILIYLAIGAGAGVLSGLFGVGGGVVIVPALIYLIGLNAHTAVGTSLGALLLPVGLLGVLAYYRTGHIELKASLLIAVGLFLGAYLGARVALSISAINLTRAFSIFLLAVAVRMFIGTLGR